MANKTSAPQNLGWKELAFQLVLHAVTFVFYAVDRRHPDIAGYEFWYFTAYALAALVISYVLLPRYFYPKRYGHFALGLVLVIGLTILNEELVLEQIYFPDKQGKSFSGVFHALLDVMPVITVLCGFKFAWDALTRQREVEELRDAVKESELRFLKSQINPHFLFNNLNNLYSYAITNSPKTPDIILELSSVLRYMLYECQEEYVPLSKEIDQLTNFIALNELQIEERGTVNFSAPTQLNNLRIAPLILVVFVENAFKHSQSSQSEGIEIDVDVSVTDGGVLHFHCRNNFQPLANNDKLDHGIGLANVRKRLELIYPDAHELDIQTEAGYYTVNLSLTLTEARPAK